MNIKFFCSISTFQNNELFTWDPPKVSSELFLFVFYFSFRVSSRHRCLYFWHVLVHWDHYFIWCLIFLSLAYGSLFRLTFVSLVCFLVWKFSPSGTKSLPSSVPSGSVPSGTKSLPRPVISHFSKEAWSLLVENVFRGFNLGTRVSPAGYCCIPFSVHGAL